MSDQKNSHHDLASKLLSPGPLGTIALGACSIVASISQVEDAGGTTFILLIWLIGWGIARRCKDTAP